MEFCLRTAGGMLSTRPGGAVMPPGHVEELGDAMAAAGGWGLSRVPVHIVDREADSVGHYRQWEAANRLGLVRADAARRVRHGDRQRTLNDVVSDLAGEFDDSRAGR